MKNICTRLLLPKIKTSIKTNRAMKLTCALLFAASFGVFATGNAQTMRVNIQVENVSTEKVLSEIEKQTDYLFVYNQNEVDLKRKTSVNAVNKTTAEVLSTIFNGTDIIYAIEGENIMLMRKEKNLAVVPDAVQQDNKITGTVLDATGMPVIGANIMVKGTTNGTITDMDGKFSLDVAKGETLIVTYVGYANQEISVSNQKSLSITLKEDSEALDELIVVGYGVVKKSDLTGSVSTVKSSELNSIPSGSVMEALQGRSAGLQVKQNSGSPGGSISVRIRGANSIQGSNEPLYVIDGFPSSTTNPSIIDNSDIESIEVLKDASAIAIYGSRGANGVIMITTKKGRPGKTKVDFETTIGFQSIRNKLEMMNAQEYATFYNIQHMNDGLEPYFSEDEIKSMGNGFDWQDFVFQRAPMRTHSLTVSGGSDKTQFSVSANIFDQQGILKGSEYKRYSLRANLNHNISEKVTLNYSTSLSRNILDNKNWGGGRFGASLISSALCSPPTLTPYNDDGSYRELHSAYPFVSEGLTNPLNYINEVSDQTVSNKVLANIAFIYEPIKDLSIKISGGIENSDDRNDYYKTLKFVNSKGEANVNTSQYTSVLSENTINYVKTFNKKHNFSLLAGFTYQDFYAKSLGGSGTGFLSDVTYTGNLASASVPGIPTSSYSKSVLLSYLSRLNYSFDNRYLFTISFRADGSSKYSNGNKWGYFPSGAFAWKIIEEEFMKNNCLISDLKLRTSYGLTGSQAIEAYATLNNLYSGKTVFGDARYTTLAPGTQLPGDLKWETTAQFDLGVDVGLMDNRFLFTADYYIKNTKDLLNTVQLPSSLGYTTTLKNVGRVQNRGFEFSFDANVFNDEFIWKLNGNLAVNRSQVKELYGGQDILGGWVDMLLIADNVSLLREGEAMGVFYGYLRDGYDENGSEKYVDLSGDGVINQNDKTIIGDPNPDFIYGLNSLMSYKSFDLSLFFQGTQGNDIVNISSIDNSLNYGYGCNLLKDVVGNNWTPENPTAKYPKITRNQTMNFSDRLVENGSYLRLKNIELAYNFPVNKWKQNWLNKLRIYISAQNILTFTKYSGWDPEVNSQGGANSIAQGIDHFAYPTAKSYTFGINIGF